MDQVLLKLDEPGRVLHQDSASDTNVQGTSSTFNLGDEQKRWLVVGICLNKVLLPSLRDFLKPKIEKHYNNLKTSHNIDNQTYTKHLAKDKKMKLNYESINNNEARHRRNVKLYDYNVKTEVDLAKLYLKPFMAKFSALDDTCDLSAVLGILLSASVFSSAIQQLSNDVRNDVRNEWGRVAFSSWTPEKFAKSFQLMDSLLRALNLDPSHEKTITDELGDWETKGIQLCFGNVVGADLVKMIKGEISQLQEVKRLEINQQDEAQRINDALNSVQESIEEFKKALKDPNQKVDEIGASTSAIAQDVETLKGEKDDTARRLGEVEEKQKHFDKRVEYI